jgi:hypothetical protein
MGDRGDGGDQSRNGESFRTPERQPRPEHDADAMKGIKGLHVDVPPANNDVLRILDAGRKGVLSLSVGAVYTAAVTLFVLVSGSTRSAHCLMLLCCGIRV